MNSVSETLAEHKKKLPAKYDRKGQPNIVGSDELPHPIAITEGQRKGSHHFHFQHGPYERRFAMCASNFYSCKVQLSCMARKCPARASVIPKNPDMIKCTGERETSKGHKKGTKIKKKYAINWESPDSLIPDNWKVVPTSVIAHSCKQHPQKSTKDIVRAKNSADCLEKRKNNTRDNLKHFAVYSHFPPNILGGPDDFIPPSTELTNTCL
jgi:hypothetical protein